VIAIDTNLLVYAHRVESPWHARAAYWVRTLAEGSGTWAIPWPCVHEFFAKVTHASIFTPPTKPERAMDFLSELLSSPTLTLLAEGDGHLERLSMLVRTGLITGARVHDARIAALCLEHGVSELWTADRDFGRFPSLRSRNPLVDDSD